MAEDKRIINVDHPNGTDLKKGEVVVMHEAPSIERLSKLTGFEGDDLLKHKGPGRVLLCYRDTVHPTVFEDRSIIHGIGHGYWFLIDESTCNPT